MADLFIGIGCIGLGVAVLIGVHFARVRTYSAAAADDSAITALRAELTRCTGAMMHCAQRGAV